MYFTEIYPYIQENILSTKTDTYMKMGNGRRD